MSGKDPKGYYKVLGLSPGASVADVRRAYSTQQAKFHMDSPIVREKLRNAKSEDEKEKIISECKEMSTKLNMAKDALFDEKKKKNYDSGMGEFGAQFSGGNYSDIFDIFSQFAGGGRGGQKSNKASSTKYVINISLKEAFCGKTSKFNVKREKICPSCDGKGAENTTVCKKCNGNGVYTSRRNLGGFVTLAETQCDGCSGKGYFAKGNACGECKGGEYVQDKIILEVTIKPGVVKGEKIVFEGMGDQRKGQVSGDVIFIIDVQDDSRFERRGSDLIGKMDIPLYTAIGGGVVYFTHIDGRQLEINVEPFKTFDVAVKIRGEGFKTQRSGLGSLILKPNIIIGGDSDRAKILEVLSMPNNKPYGATTKVKGEFGSIPEPEREHDEASDDGAQSARSFFNSFSFF
ncbi:DnaJ-class molecular chaperone [Ordospora colligata]|uniref:DnaJ-class molecular chaperone n=1 Tax=Ordospora colligata OC4 TaxID=1354746 RepID=A0A0B2UJ35_9MICR|nr:DnaJ-class molecular chaperone [Ordospora colligata OC4]KHN69338.1 DnaJ-class molecular chaperone [Ordospora colligata OC4]TBU14852.1 DnaJ-class molecular chaperone [Ordospora colligata]TBU14983.1 DnaJ-class molecular chaperone [Ordospora colligata]TBU18367.1 DnaJ-class molecular chaperone [Ordospora colligata]